MGAEDDPDAAEAPPCMGLSSSCPERLWLLLPRGLLLLAEAPAARGSNGGGKCQR